MFARLPSCKITGAVLLALVIFCFTLANAPRAEAKVRPPNLNPLPVCTTEDASSGPVPCVWLGGPNGVGHNYRVYANGAHRYVGECKALWLVGNTCAREAGRS